MAQIAMAQVVMAQVAMDLDDEQIRALADQLLGTDDDLEIGLKALDLDRFLEVQGDDLYRYEKRLKRVRTALPVVQNLVSGLWIRRKQ